MLNRFKSRKLVGKFVLVSFALSFLAFQTFYSNFILAASSPWSQTDWSGSNFSSSSSVTTSTANQVTLTPTESLSNTGFETDLTSWATGGSFSDSDFSGNANAIAAWPLDDTDTAQSYSRVINPAVSLGRNIVLNGTFDTDTLWSKSTSNWTVSGGAAHSDGTGNSVYLYQSMPLVSGKSYQVTFTVSNYVSGSVRVLVNSAGTGTYRSANGTYVETVAASGANNTLYFATHSSTSFVGDIDDVSIKQVDIPASSSFTGSELLTDGDMEAADTSAWGGTDITIAKDISTVHAGLKSIKITAIGATARLRQQLSGVLGKRLNISGWVYVPSGNTLAPQLRLGTTSTGNEIGSAAFASTKDTWIYTSFEVISSSDTPYFNVSGAANGESIYIDDLSVTEIDPLSGAPANGVTLGDASNGHLDNAYTFDGTNDYVNIYSTDLNSAFNPDAGTLIAWAKVSGSGVWSDGTARYVLDILADSNNYIDIRRTTANDVLRLEYVANGTNKGTTYTTSDPTEFFQVVITWDNSADEVKTYFNGSQVGTTLTGLGTWVGNILSTSAVIGVCNTTICNPWSGQINDVQLYNAALSPAQIAALYSNSSHNTGTTYSSSSGAAKVLSATDENTTLTQSVNVGDTNSYNMTAYAYTDGTAVTSADAGLYANGSSVSTTYTSVGSGWYKLTGTTTGTASSVGYGVKVLPGKTVYLDNMALYEYPTSGTLTSSIFDSGGSVNWGALTYAATVPSNTTLGVKVRAGSSSDLSDATAFSSCSAITSGSTVGGTTCALNGKRYAQYQLSFTSSDLISTPTFTSFSLPFNTSFTADLVGPGNNDYTNNLRQSFAWKRAASSGGVAKYIIDIASPGSSIIVDNIQPDRSTDLETSKYVVHYDTNNLTFYTKSSSDWSTNENDGELREGPLAWKVTAVDGAGNETSANRSLFVDITKPSLDITSINSSNFADSLATADTTPTINGKVTDTLSGDSDTTKVASGPDKVEIKFEKQGFGGVYTLTDLATVNIPTSYWTDSNEEIKDNTQNTANKYGIFSFTPGNSLALGTYKVTVTPKDKAGNWGDSIVFYLTVSTSGEIQQIVPSSTPTTEEPQATPQPVEEQVVPVPTPTPAPSGPGLISRVGNVAANVLNGLANAFKAVVRGGVNVAGQAIAMWNNYQDVKKMPGRANIALIGATSRTISGINIRESIANAVNPKLAGLQEFTQRQKVKAIAIYEILFDKSPTVITNVKVAEVGPDYAVISWDTNHYTTNNKINYGIDTSYGQDVLSQERSRHHELKITGLKPDTKYAFEVMSQNGNYVYDASHEFTTSGQ